GCHVRGPGAVDGGALGGVAEARLDLVLPCARGWREREHQDRGCQDKDALHATTPVVHGVNSPPPVAGAEAGGELVEELPEDSKPNSLVVARGACEIGGDSWDFGVVPWLGSLEALDGVRALTRTGR